MSPNDELLHQAQLRDAWLTEARFVENRAFDAAAAEQLSYGVSHESAIEFEAERALVRFNVEVEWREGSELASNYPFDVAVAVTGEFGVENYTEDQHRQLEEWLAFNSVHLLWPYARAYISTITGASSHMPLTLFTISVPRARILDPETGEFEAVHHDSGAGPARPAG